MIFLYIALVVLVLIVTLFLYLIFPAIRRHPDRKKLDGLYIAHRGLHDDENPENSLVAFELAVQKGYAIENDIHVTADGKVVVFHDGTLKRMCDAEGRIEDMTLAELKAYRLKDSAERIPTLEECLELVNGRVPLLIEFKCDDKSCDRLCKAADKILSEYKGDYFVQSFYPPAMKWYRKNRPSVCRGQLAYSGKDEGILKRIAGAMLCNYMSRPDFVAYRVEDAKNPFRRLCILLGAFPVGWTFRSKEQLKNLKKYFKTYIFENFIP